MHYIVTTLLVKYFVEAWKENHSSNRCVNCKGVSKARGQSVGYTSLDLPGCHLETQSQKGQFPEMKESKTLPEIGAVGH